MEETMLTLKQGVTLIEQSGQAGFSLNGNTRFAKDARQIAILQAMAERPLPLGSLTALLRDCESPPDGANEIPLAIAEFILDFGEFLEA
jgi:hypothetical protein